MRTARAAESAPVARRRDKRENIASRDFRSCESKTRDRGGGGDAAQDSKNSGLDSLGAERDESHTNWQARSGRQRAGQEVLNQFQEVVHFK